MKRLVLLSLLSLVPITSAAYADGCPPTTCGTTSVAAPGSRLLIVRPHGHQGPALGYDLLARTRRFSLPSGMLTADGNTFVSAQGRQGREFTQVRRYDMVTGRLRTRWSLGGRWNVGAVSADGRRVALVAYGAHRTFVSVAGRRGRSQVAVLNGNFQVEALSPDSRRVFLVHWRRNGYDLQNLDLETRALNPTRLSEPDEKMAGTALSALGTRDGRWLHTLYVKANGEAFVHALDLHRGIGHCIDLPVRGDLLSLGATALGLSPDERRLYLASPLLGRVTTVDLERLKVSRSDRFRAVPLGRFVSGIGPNAAINPNGRMLAFSAGSRLWLYDAAYGAVRSAASSHEIQGLGFHPNGRQVLALGSSGKMVAFDAATGKRAR